MGQTKTIIGMIHLQPLAGSPLRAGSFDQTREAALYSAGTFDRQKSQ